MTCIFGAFIEHPNEAVVVNLNVKRSCANCPFRKQGAIELHPGRLEGIVGDLLADDRTPFLCHKTVYREGNEGEVVVDEDGNEESLPGPKSSVCAGSMVFLHKLGQPNVAMRLGYALKMITPEDLDAQRDQIIEPEDIEIEVPERPWRRPNPENPS